MENDDRSPSFQGAPDGWALRSARFSSLFLALSFSGSPAESQPAHLRLAQTVSPLDMTDFLDFGNIGTIDYRKISFWQLLALSMLLTFVAQFIHEAGHCAVYEFLDTKPVWSV